MRPATKSDETSPTSIGLIPTAQRLRSGIVAAACATLLAAALATAAPAAAARAEAPHTSAPAAAPSLTTLSIFQPDHLLQSTGNLCWTFNVGSTGGRHYARLYSMSKAGPAGTAFLRYQESGTDLIYLRALAYAKVGTQWYAYFVVDNARTRSSVIKRVDLAGGQAVTIVASPRYIGSRGLVTDGQFLFWADEGGLRRSTIGGTGLTTLATGASFGSVGLDLTKVYFSFGSSVWSTPKSGTSLEREVTGTSAITSLAVRNTVLTSLYWSERNGSVRGRNFLSERVTYQGPSTAGRRATSVSASGSRVAWTDCAAEASDCRTRRRTGNVTISVPVGDSAMNVQLDDTATFWGDGAGLRKFAG
jgi:hypothetical protein